MLKIIEVDTPESTRIHCPKCKDILPYVSLSKDSKVDGLSFVCRRCKRSFKVKTE